VSLVRPRRRGAHPLWVAVGAAAGVGLMYFFDPDRGAQRRAIVRDKARRYLRLTSEAVDGRSRDMMNRARGLVVEMRSRAGRAQERTEPWAPANPEARRS